MVLQTRVAELRREIGLLRAVGASQTWVRTRVVGHTVILFLSAGLPGIIAGLILSLRISVDDYWSMTLTPAPVVQVLLAPG